MSNKVSLSWIPQLINNYKEQQEKVGKESKFKLAQEEAWAKRNAANEILELIKQFIADSNKLQGK